jgi:hypothetical protein
MGRSILSICFSFLISVLFLTSSCNHYIDRVTAPVNQGYLTFYPDSNILIYKSNVGLVMDKEKYSPKSFYTRLPKGIKWYEMENSQTFRFYYANAQVILISIDLFNAPNKIDTSYIPMHEEINKLIMSASSTNKKFNINRIGINEARKQIIIKKEAATILLYNIKPENLETFRATLESLEFLK